MKTAEMFFNLNGITDQLSSCGKGKQTIKKRRMDALSNFIGAGIEIENGAIYVKHHSTGKLKPKTRIDKIYYLRKTTW